MFTKWVNQTVQKAKTAAGELKTTVAQGAVRTREFLGIHAALTAPQLEAQLLHQAAHLPNSATHIGDIFRRWASAIVASGREGCNRYPDIEGSLEDYSVVGGLLGLDLSDGDHSTTADTDEDGQSLTSGGGSGEKHQHSASRSPTMHGSHGTEEHSGEGLTFKQEKQVSEKAQQQVKTLNDEIDNMYTTVKKKVVPYMELLTAVPAPPRAAPGAQSSSSSALPSPPTAAPSAATGGGAGARAPTAATGTAATVATPPAATPPAAASSTTAPKPKESPAASKPKSAAAQKSNPPPPPPAGQVT
eukprot:Selendium_serpulae@DN5117_c0_g1_i2.p1